MTATIALAITTVAAVAAMVAILFATSNLAYMYAARFGGAVALNTCCPLQFDEEAGGALRMPTCEELKRIDESIYHYREALSTGLWIAGLIFFACIAFCSVVVYRGGRAAATAPETPTTGRRRR